MFMEAVKEYIWLATWQGKIYKKKPPSRRHEIRQGGPCDFSPFGLDFGTLGLWTQSRQLLLIGAFQSGQQCNCACVSHHNPCRSADDQPFHHSPGPEWPSHHRQVVFVIIM